MHTAREIEKGLAKQDWPQATIDQVVDDLKRQGYLDDMKFAEAWVADRCERRLQGPFRLLGDLLSRGVEESTARMVIERLLPKEREMVLAGKAAEKKYRTIKGSGVRAKAALHRHLTSRGFQHEVIRSVLSGFPFEEEQI
jgi:regulatory protein